MKKKKSSQPLLGDSSVQVLTDTVAESYTGPQPCAFAFSPGAFWKPQHGTPVRPALPSQFLIPEMQRS